MLKTYIILHSLSKVITDLFAQSHQEEQKEITAMSLEKTG